MRKLFYILQCLPLIAFCQNHPIYTFDQFEEIETEVNGGPRLITYIEEDTDGFLWIGSTTGLYRFDGDHFMNFPMVSTKGDQLGEIIRQLLLFNKDTILVATNYGLGITSTTGLVVDTRFFNSDSQEYFLEDNFIRWIARGKEGTLWIFTKTAIHLLDKNLQRIGSVALEKHPNVINANPVRPSCFALDEKRLVVNMIIKPGVPLENNWYLVDINKKTIAPTKIPLPKNLMYSTFIPVNIENFILPARKQGDSLTAFYLFNTNKMTLKKLVNYDLSDKIENYNNKPYVNKEQSGISFSIYKSGFFFDTLTNSIQEEYRNFKPYSGYKKMKNGVVYAGNRDRLFRLTPINKNMRKLIVFDSLLEKNKFNDYVTDFLKIKKSIYIGTHGKNIFEYDSLTNKINGIQLSNKGSSSMVWNMRIHDESSFWVGTQDGLFTYDVNSGKSKRWQHPDKPKSMGNSPITIQFVDSQGLVWIGIGFGNGLVAYDPKTNFIKHYSYDKNKFPLRAVVAIAEDQNGNLWLGNQTGGGLILWNRKTGLFKKINISKERKYPTDFIEGMIVDHANKLWIATRYGLYKYDVEKNHFKRYSIENGLISNYINCVYQDKNHNIWIGTGKGVNILRYNDEKIWSYTKSKGVPGYEVVKIKPWNVNEDTIFVGATNGFCLIDANQLIFKNGKLSFYSEPLKVNGNIVSYDANTTLKLDYKQNNISINFGVINHKKEGENKYFYRLGKNNTPWVPLKTKGELQLFGLGPDDYVLQLKVCVNGTDCVESEDIYFNIAVPFWKSWWFTFVLMALAIGITTIFYKVRIFNIRKIDQVRRQISADLHDDVGASISSVRILSDFLKDNDAKTESKIKVIDAIKEQSSHISDVLEEIIWNTNPKNDRLITLVSRMQQQANEIIENADIDLEWHMSIQQENINIEANRKKEIYLFFKEAINNIVKHAQCKQTWINIRSDNNYLNIMIKDDGIGYDTSTVYQSNGLESLENRAKVLNATLRIDSDKGKGTNIHLKCAL